MTFPFPVICPKSAAAATISFRPILTDPANLTTYTFTGADIGTANANRVVALGVMLGGAGITVTASIGGNAATKKGSSAEVAGHYAAIWALAVPSGTTADIVITASSAPTHCAVAVWAIVPGSSLEPIDTASNTTAGATTVVANDLETAVSGVVVACTITTASSITSATWSGSDSVTSNANAPIETQIYGAFSFLTTQAATTNDLTINLGSSAAAAVASASFR